MASATPEPSATPQPAPVPGADSPENNKMASAAFDNFKKVLEQEPQNTVAIASIASLNLNQKKWDEAQ